MLFINIALIAIGISAGIVVGNAAAAFITLLGVVPRFIQISDTERYIKLYWKMLIFGMVSFSLFYFLDFSFKISKYISIFLGLFFGTFIGIFASALAEVLNVIPVLTKKLELEYFVSYLIIALILGKITGSLIYWLVLVKL